MRRRHQRRAVQHIFHHSPGLGIRSRCAARRGADEVVAAIASAATADDICIVRVKTGEAVRVVLEGDEREERHRERISSSDSYVKCSSFED